MAADCFVAFVLEQLADVDRVACRPMFGGHGLYRGSEFFGIVFEGRLYLKTDHTTAPQFVRRGMKPFKPRERQTLRAYYEVPPDVLESRTELAAWAEAAATTK